MLIKYKPDVDTHLFVGRTAKLIKSFCKLKFLRPHPLIPLFIPNSLLIYKWTIEQQNFLLV